MGPGFLFFSGWYLVHPPLSVVWIFGGAGCSLQLHPSILTNLQLEYSTNQRKDNSRQLELQIHHHRKA
jgi:hypothetical protein